jgi:NAD(P)-dependent dehydrogenase (short-subunit alcohol dehydrogenase family)
VNVLDRFRLDGKVAVVTGGTGLYGTPFCRALAQAGATVVVTSRRLAKARAGADDLAADGLSAVGMELDQSDPDSIARFAERLLGEVGGIDVLVNNAVHRQGAGWDATTAQDWDATSATNSRGLFLLTQALVPSMIGRGGGSVINIGSIYGIVAPTFGIYRGTTMTSPAFYSYDKAGMIGLTRYLASALGPSGIRVNCLSPGGLGTRGQSDPFVANYTALTPLGRQATEDDVTGALVFLASDASGYVTGVTLPVDGGWTVH